MDISKKKRIALVLSGGGVKAAAFHIGVCLALKEKGFTFLGGGPEAVKRKDKGDPKTIRLYVGSSAGSYVSAVLASGYTVNALVNSFDLGGDLHSGKNSQNPSSPEASRLKPLTYRHLFALNGSSLVKIIPDVFQRSSLVTGGFETLLKNGFKLNGLFTTRGVEKYLRQHVLPENDFSKLGVDLFVVCTELNNPNKVIFGTMDAPGKTPGTRYANYATISDAVAASGSLPPFYSPYGINKDSLNKDKDPNKNVYFFDGEIRETLSTHVASDHGADLIISSYSVEPYRYNPKMGSLHKYGIPVIINQALYQVIQQKIEKHRRHQENLSAIYSGIESYCKKQGIAVEQRDKLLQIVCQNSNFKPGVDWMYIHPTARNYEMFFVDHFSLNPKILSRIVSIGFRSALATLKEHDLT